MTSILRDPLAPQWQESAVLAFKAALADLTGTPVEDIRVTLLQHRHTAAVSWSGYLGQHLDVALYLPAMKIDTRIPRDKAAILAGYWLHEAAHVVNTREHMMRDLTREGGQALARIGNGFEDPRIEADFARRGSGAAGNAKARFRSLVAYITRDLDPEKFDVTDKRNAPFLVALLGRWKNNGTAPDDLCAAIWAKCPPWLRAALDVGFRKIDGGTCEDTMQAARDFVAAWNAAAQGDQQEGDQPEAGEGDQQEGDQPEAGEGDQQEGDQQEGDQQEGDKAEAGDGEAGDGEADDDKADTEGEAGGARGALDGAGTPDAIDAGDDLADAEPDISDVIAEIGAAEGVDLTGSDKQFRRLSDPAKTSTKVARLRDSVHGVARSRYEVSRLLAGQDRADWVRNLDSGQFDPRAAYRVRMGRRDTYRRADRADAPVAALSVLIDQSYSMRGPLAEAAAALAINLSDAADAAGAPCEVHGFDHGDLTIFRAFGDNPRAVRPGFSKLTRVTGGTDFTGAIIAAGSRLLAAPADARVLVALTDGQCGHGARMVRKAFRRMSALGVTTCAVFLSWTDDLDRAAARGADGADAWLAATPGNLTHKVFGALADQLDGRPRRRAA